MTIKTTQRPYQICTRCIMDTSDSNITFDQDGVCSYCRRFEGEIAKSWHPNDEGRRLLDEIVKQVKTNCRDKAYDCVIGLSGGVDSSYLAYVASRELELRLLAVHVDGGWNSELAVKNIEGIVKKLNIDLYTEVVDWEEMRDLQRAFLRASLANQDVPQDHAFTSALYRQAISHKIPYVLSGGNIATESILPEQWAYTAMDLRHLMAVHRRFGEKRLETFPTLSFLQYYFWYPVVRRLKVIRPLNYLPYNKDAAIRTLADEVGFQYYGGKHFESRFTKWQQIYYRPMKFGYDERRAYLSSLVLSDQISRAVALETLASEIYSNAAKEEESEYVRKKLGFTREEFHEILELPPRTFRDYPSNYHLFNLKNRLKSKLAALGIKVRPRS